MPAMTVGEAKNQIAAGHILSLRLIGVLDAPLRRNSLSVNVEPHANAKHVTSETSGKCDS